MSEILITGALWHIAGPGPIDSTVSCQQAGRIVALSASVGNGSGKRQAIMDLDLGISWSSRVSTGDDWKEGGEQLFIWTLIYLLLFCECRIFGIFSLIFLSASRFIYQLTATHHHRPLCPAL